MMLSINRPEFPEINRQILRTHSTHRDSVSELVGEVEVAIKNVFSDARISF